VCPKPYEKYDQYKVSDHFGTGQENACSGSRQLEVQIGANT
jgi:hypothetical protein